jgi:uncharacterized RDD family membrane protein YckC
MTETIAPSVTYAGFWRRKTAYGIDVLIVLVLYLLVSWLLGSIAHAQTAEIQALKDIGWVSPDTDAAAIANQLQNPNSGMAIASINTAFFQKILFELALSIVVSAFYNIWFVAGSWQATPGKHWLGMKVVMENGSPLTLTQSAARHFATGISMAMLGLGYLTMAFRADKAALHDLICGTRVVRV